MIEYSIFKANSFIHSFEYAMPRLQDFYMEFGLHLSQKEAFITSAACLGLFVGVLIWMLSDK